MSKKEVWEKLSTPAPKKIKFTVPPHFCKDRDGPGYHIEGTNTPFDPNTYNEDDYSIWIDDPFGKDNE